jgi:hypothetical protein
MLTQHDAAELKADLAQFCDTDNCPVLDEELNALHSPAPFPQQIARRCTAMRAGWTRNAANADPRLLRLAR